MIFLIYVHTSKTTYIKKTEGVAMFTIESYVR